MRMPSAIEKLARETSSPCDKCPYKLGLVKMVKNPCPECRIDGYRTYEWLQKRGKDGEKEH